MEITGVYVDPGTFVLRISCFFFRIMKFIDSSTQNFTVGFHGTFPLSWPEVFFFWGGEGGVSISGTGWVPGGIKMCVFVLFN